MADTKNYMEEELKDLREQFDRSMGNALAHIDSVQARVHRIQKILDRMQKRFNQN